MTRIAIMWAMFAEYNKTDKAVNPYGNGYAFEKISGILEDRVE